MCTSASFIHGGPHRRRGGGGENEFPCQSTLHWRYIPLAPKNSCIHLSKVLIHHIPFSTIVCDCLSLSNGAFHILRPYIHRRSRSRKIATEEGTARPGEREEEEEGNGGPPRRRASGVSCHLREAHPRVCVSEGDESTYFVDPLARVVNYRQDCRRCYAINN